MIAPEDLAKLDYVFSIASTILTTKSLIDGGIEPVVSELILPSLILSFGPSLIANTLAPKYQLTYDALILYAIGFSISLVVYSNNFIMFFLNEVPHISKFFSLVSLKNSKEDTFSLMTYKITAKLAGIFLNNLVLKKRQKIKMEEILSIFFTYSGIIYLRYYNYKDYYIIVIANIVPLVAKAIDCLNKWRISKANDIEVEKDYDEEKKRPKRKASSVSKTKKNK